MLKQCFVLLGLCFVFTCQTMDRAQITKVEAEAIADQVLKMWNLGDLSFTEELFSPDYVRHHPTPMASASLEDLKNTVLSNREVFPDYHLEFKDMIINTDKIIVAAIMTGTNTGPLGDVPATNKKVRMDGIYIYRVADHKIAEEWTYFNLLHYHQQLGYSLVPPPGDDSTEKTAASFYE
jgi:steroid delta-isomerase-like uncharacterized protein